MENSARLYFGDLILCNHSLWQDLLAPLVLKANPLPVQNARPEIGDVKSKDLFNFMRVRPTAAEMLSLKSAVRLAKMVQEIPAFDLNICLALTMELNKSSDYDLKAYLAL
jgi:hypothetical protein